MRYNVILWIICVATIFLSCKKSTDSTTGPNDYRNLIKNSSFEIGGQPSLEGWNIEANLPQDNWFSDDVPPSGGRWSLALHVGDRIVRRVRTTIATPDGSNRYKLSLWAKSKGEPGHALLIFNKAIRGRINVQDSVWRYYEVTDSLFTIQGDSLSVELNAGVTYLFGQTFFDLCRLEVFK